jgi:hypothetical protein
MRVMYLSAALGRNARYRVSHLVRDVSMALSVRRADLDPRSQRAARLSRVRTAASRKVFLLHSRQQSMKHGLARGVGRFAHSEDRFDACLEAANAPPGQKKPATSSQGLACLLTTTTYPSLEDVMSK